jgi:hypothetical protein
MFELAQSHCTFARGFPRGRIIERHRLSRIGRLHVNLSSLATAIAENETVGAIVLNGPPIRLALIDRFPHGSVKICADRQVATRNDTAHGSIIT